MMLKKLIKIILLSYMLILLPQTVLANTPVFDENLRQRLVEAINDSESFTDKYVAEVWLTDMSQRMRRYVKNKEERIAILKVLHEEAKRVDIAPELILSVIQVESAFNRFAISSVGARGLMQVMPFWLKEIGKPHENMFDIRVNLRMGCTILRYYLDREKNDKVKALARYNGSVGKRKYPDKVFKALNRRWYRQ